MDEIEKLRRDLGKIPKDLRKELRPGVRLAALPVLKEAKRRAAWSTRIPKATRLSVKFGRNAGAFIAVSAKKAPHARAYEHDGEHGIFWHPTWGNRKKMVPQKSRPFLHPALEAKADVAVKRITRIVDVVTRAAGFR